MNWSSLRYNWLNFKTSGKLPNHCRGIYRIYLKLINQKLKDHKCHRLHSKTLGFWLIVPKNLPGHCCRYHSTWKSHNQQKRHNLQSASAMIASNNIAWLLIHHLQYHWHWSLWVLFDSFFMLSSFCRLHLHNEDCGAFSKSALKVLAK